MVTRVKVCGLTRIEDIDVAVRSGAHALGFVFEPTSPRFVGAYWDELSQAIPIYVTVVAVYGNPPSEIPKRVDAVQAIWTSSAELPRNVRTIQTIRLRDDLTVQQALDERVRADAFLLDAFDPQQYGGAGKTVDWQKAALFVESCPKAVILAGGLNPDNVQEAVRIVRPYAVDVSSGIEASPGVKDALLIERFLERVQK
jgi:phosphoribosylanthranilate isomerase